MTEKIVDLDIANITPSVSDPGGGDSGVRLKLSPHPVLKISHGNEIIWSLCPRPNVTMLP